MKRGNFMTNTQRYLNSIKGFRKDLQEVNDKFRPEYERLERFKDSGSYAQSKKLLDDRRNAEVDALRLEYADRLKSAVDAMEKTYMNRPASAPTQEQLSVLQALKLRDHVSRDELKRAAQTMRGCPVAERALEEIARKSGEILGLEQEISSDTVRENLHSLRVNAGRLVSNLQAPNSRREHMSRSDWTLFRLDVDPADENDCLRIFGLCANGAQFAAAVNEAEGGTQA